MSPANDNRPAGFDAALEAYLPSLRRQAIHRTGNRAVGEELLQEAVVHMLNRAAGCRMDTFKTWAQLVLRSAASQFVRNSRRLKRNAPEMSIDAMAVDDNEPLENRCAQLRTQPDQFAKMDLSEVIDTLRGIPNGDIVLRAAEGETLKAIGDERGQTRENIRQKHERAIQVLRKRLQRRAA